MTERIGTLAFGLADQVPANATGAWGCRAIVRQDGYVDIPPDRTDRQGDPRILDLLNAEYPLNVMTDAIAGLLRDGTMDTRSRQTIILHGPFARLTVVADTCASGGYCYVAAWTASPAHLTPDLDRLAALYRIELTAQERFLWASSPRLLTPLDQQRAYLLGRSLAPMQCPACGGLICVRSASGPDDIDGVYPDDAYSCPFCQARLTWHLSVTGTTWFTLSPGQQVTIEYPEAK